jgi:beta-mannanase
MPTWAEWENPWIFHGAYYGWDAWLAASSAHQVVMSQDLIPNSVSNKSDPLAWEQPCANGDYDQYATALAKNLVSYGAGSTVIRLGPEGNGNWENDYIGTTSAEMSDWAKCYSNEVIAMRAVPGAHFLFVWNPNICTANIPLSKSYPGNSYVDIIGADAYDRDCGTLKTVAQEGWKSYSTDSSDSGARAPDFPSLTHIETFAVAHGKPMSFPEWGLYTGDDDPAYVTELAQMFKSGDFAYQSYFDNHDNGIAPLGSATPKSTANYAKAFK